MDRDADAAGRAARWLMESREVVVFTGAGASAESGIPTFRDDDGLWRTFPPDQFANWASLLRMAAARPARAAEFVCAVLQPIAAKLDRARLGRFVLLRVLAAVRPMAGVRPSGVYRPSVVLFGDALAEPAWSQALEACRRCDLLVQVGCSGAVWPAAMLPEVARSAGARVIAVDPTQSPADLWLRGTAAEVLPEIVRRAS